MGEFDKKRAAERKEYSKKDDAESVIRLRIHDRFQKVFDLISECYSDWNQEEKPSFLPDLFQDLLTYEALTADRAVHIYKECLMQERIAEMGNECSAEACRQLAFDVFFATKKRGPKKAQALQATDMMLTPSQQLEILVQIDANRPMGLHFGELIKELDFGVEKTKEIRRYLNHCMDGGVISTEGQFRGLRYVPGPKFKQEIKKLSKAEEQDEEEENEILPTEVEIASDALQEDFEDGDGEEEE